MRSLPLFLICVLLCMPALAAEPQIVIEAKHRAFFQAYCVRCHNAEVHEGKVRLDDLALVIDSIPIADRWQKVLNALNSGEMPPEDEKQPADDEKAAFLKDSRGRWWRRKKLSDTGGQIIMCRLNKREYVNTMRDLLGVEVDARELPNDGGGGTLDTVGSSLFFSSDQFEQYLAIAQKPSMRRSSADPGPRSRHSVSSPRSRPTGAWPASCATTIWAAIARTSAGRDPAAGPRLISGLSTIARWISASSFGTGTRPRSSTT